MRTFALRTWKSRALATAAAAAIALTTFSLQPASAAGRHGGDVAALAAFAAVFGTIAAIVAAEQDRDQPYYAPPYGYGPQPYRGPHWQGHGPQHRHW
jgi:hypothetical protein